MTILFPILYSAALTYLVWKAFKVMSNGWGFQTQIKNNFINQVLNKKTILSIQNFLISQVT